MTSPINRNDLLGKQWKCLCGQTHIVPTRYVIIKAGALENLPFIIGQYAKHTDPILLVSDQITHKIAGTKLVEKLRTKYKNINEFVIKEKKPVADDRTADFLLSQINNEKLLISCGSGTITDLVKYAAFKKNIPFVAVATAPSMNGYASGIVALTCDGLKTTVTSAPAVAVIADIDLLSQAPIEMTRAGLGDLISKAVSNADWKLASLIKHEHFCDLPYKIVADLESVYINDAALLRKGDKKIIAALAEGLVFSGISMVIAGSSAPASGAEHLISHTIDIKSALNGVDHDYHGTQVGVATIVTAGLYERICSFDSRNIDWKETEKRCQRDKIDDIKKYWGNVSDSVMKEYDKKRMSWEDKKQELLSVVDQWDLIINQIKKFVWSKAKIEKALKDAGAKTDYSQINLTRDEFVKAVLMASTMRSRYTVLDLAEDLGILEEFVHSI